jgi:hypothetical protein
VTPLRLVGWAEEPQAARIRQDGDLSRSVTASYWFCGDEPVPYARLAVATGWLGQPGRERPTCYEMDLRLPGLPPEEVARLLVAIRAALEDDRRRHRVGRDRIRRVAGLPYVGPDPDAARPVDLREDRLCDRVDGHHIVVYGLVSFRGRWGNPMTAGITAERDRVFAAITALLSGTAVTPGAVAARFPLVADAALSPRCRSCDLRDGCERVPIRSRASEAVAMEGA